MAKIIFYTKTGCAGELNENETLELLCKDSTLIKRPLMEIEGS